MRMWVYRVLALVFFTAGVVLGIGPNHYIAAFFCLAFGAASLVRSVITAGDGDRKAAYHDEHSV